MKGEGLIQVLSTWLKVAFIVLLSLLWESAGYGAEILKGSFKKSMIRVDLDLEIEQDVCTLFVAYSLTQTLDMGIAVPIVVTRHDLEPGSDAFRSTGCGDETNIETIILQGKYNFMKQSEGSEIAIGGDLMFPAGDDDTLPVEREINLLVHLMASRTFRPVEEFPLTTHMNLSYEMTTWDITQYSLGYSAGLNAEVHERVAIALDVIGRWSPSVDVMGDNMVTLSFRIQ